MKKQTKKIYVGQSNIHEMGILASKDIKRGEIVGVVQGPEKFKINRNKYDALAHPNWVGFKMHHWVDPIPPYKYLNHSCDPNVAIKGHKTLVAICDIKKDKEITIDYSIIEADPCWYMKCSCKAKNCRGIIRSIQYLPKRVYNNYLPFISKEFQDLYNNYHKKRKWKINQKTL